MPNAAHAETRAERTPEPKPTIPLEDVIGWQDTGDPIEALIDELEIMSTALAHMSVDDAAGVAQSLERKVTALGLLYERLGPVPSKTEDTPPPAPAPATNLARDDEASAPAPAPAHESTPPPSGAKPAVENARASVGLRAIWEDLLTARSAIDAAVPSDSALRVDIEAALGTLTRAMLALEDIFDPDDATRGAPPSASVESSLDGRPLRDIHANMLHAVTWVARYVNELHGDGADKRVADLRGQVLALVALTEDVFFLQPRKPAFTDASDKAAPDLSRHPNEDHHLNFLIDAIASLDKLVGFALANIDRDAIDAPRELQELAYTTREELTAAIGQIRAADDDDDDRAAE